MKPVCPAQFPACLLYNSHVGFVFTACLYVFPACPAEMLPTLWLKTGRLPFLTRSVQVRSVMFMMNFWISYAGNSIYMVLEIGH